MGYAGRASGNNFISNPAANAIKTAHSSGKKANSSDSCSQSPSDTGNLISLYIPLLDGISTANSSIKLSGLPLPCTHLLANQACLLLLVLVTQAGVPLLVEQSDNDRSGTRLSATRAAGSAKAAAAARLVPKNLYREALFCILDKTGGANMYDRGNQISALNFISDEPSDDKQKQGIS
ncbi:unnamed protein product [Protopolystoma xenopodis]|uniref:Uncharacterized protein n=1 Tax=Protopolystoma xenopodis TaxID=117903 RepID=A0A448WV98_9PLAT|nr:unnamed protein product [Protopolystoma xenopodis]